MEFFLRRQSSNKPVCEEKKNNSNVDALNDKAEEVYQDVYAHETQELQLPSNYLMILKQMMSMFTVLLMKKPQRSLPFDMLREQVERATKKSFPMDTMSIILALIPEGTITAEWKVDKRLKFTYKLVVSYHGSQDQQFLEQTKGQAKEILINALIENHKQWCEKQHISVPDGINVLHSDYPLQSVKLISPKVIPAAPSAQQPIEKIFEKEREARFASVEPEAQKRTEEYFAQHGEKYNGNRLRIYTMLVKEQKQKEIYQEKFGDRAAKQDQARYRLQIADIIHTAFLQQNKKSLRLKELLCTIKNNEKFVNQNDAELRSLVENISSNSNGYFQLDRASDGEYIKRPNKEGFNLARSLICQAVVN